MSDLQCNNQQVWDQLFDLLYACDEHMSDAEIDAELHAAGIDMQPAYKRLHMMIERKNARQKLAYASANRAAALKTLHDVVGPSVVDDLRTSLRDFISRAFNGPEQVVHFHKLEKSATDQDLRSLLDDLTRLAELRKAEEKHGPKAK